MKSIFSVIGIIFTVSLSWAYNLQNPRDLRNWNSYGIVGDAGVNNSTIAALRNSLSTAGVKNLLMPGDNLYIPTQTYESVWDIWKKEGFLFSIVAIGNHHKGYANEVKYFKMKSEYYAMESKGALFLVLNSDNKVNFNTQLAWLDQALTQSQYPLNFLVYHHPTITLTDRHEWEERKGFQIGMRAIIKKHSLKITTIINGHDHAAGLFLIDQTPLLLSGASWESRPLKLPLPKDQQFATAALWGSQSGGFYWTKLDYNPISKEVYAHFHRFDKKQDVCTIRISPRPLAKSRSCR